MNKKFTIICAFTVFFAFALWQVSAFKKTVSCFSFADCAEKTIYLTFDDGPSDRVTPKILDVLEQADVKATFFVIGVNAQKRQYLIEREFKQGHTVAVHSHTHRYKEIYRDQASILKDIADCNAVIKKITGSTTNVYRFPGGSFYAPERCVHAVRDAGYAYVDWNACFGDAEIENATVEQLFTAAVNSAAGHKRVVMLAHDSTDKVNTPQALERVIRYFKDNGYSFEKF